MDAKRVVGIYPEIKNPVFINQRVIDFPCVIIIVDNMKTIPTQLIQYWHLNQVDSDHVSPLYSSINYVASQHFYQLYNRSNGQMGRSLKINLWRH